MQPLFKVLLLLEGSNNLGELRTDGIAVLGFLFQKAGVRADPLLEFALASRPNATVQGENGENLPDMQCIRKNRRHAGGLLL